MKYMLMIYASEQLEAGMSQKDMAAMMEQYAAFNADLVAAGAMAGGERLRPVDTATTVRVRGGKRTCTDGPFAETKEQLGGFYMIDVADLDAAVEWAARVPTAAQGCVEVRPIWEMSEPQH